MARRVETWIEKIWNNERIRVRIDFCKECVEDTELAQDLAYMDAEYMAKEYPYYYAMLMAEVENQNIAYR